MFKLQITTVATILLSGMLATTIPATAIALDTSDKGTTVPSGPFETCGDKCWDGAPDDLKPHKPKTPPKSEASLICHRAVPITCPDGSTVSCTQKCPVKRPFAPASILW